MFNLTKNKPTQNTFVTNSLEPDNQTQETKTTLFGNFGFEGIEFTDTQSFHAAIETVQQNYLIEHPDYGSCPLFTVHDYTTANKPELRQGTVELTAGSTTLDIAPRDIETLISLIAQVIWDYNGQLTSGAITVHSNRTYHDITVYAIEDHYKIVQFIMDAHGVMVRSTVI